jgi:hypothetical protein
MKEALRLALGALQRFIKYDYNENPFDGKDVEGAEAITAIKKALAQPEQEPVAWAMLHDNGHFIDAIHPDEHARVQGKYIHPLYTTPPQRKPLSDEEIYSLADSLEIWNEDDEEWILDPNTFARAIEAKLKEKNT